MKKLTFLPAIGIFIISILIILIFWKVLPEKYRINENNDYINFYEPVARNILLGKGIITGDGKLAIRYPPGYPILLAGLFKLSQILNFSEQKIVSLFILFCMGVSSVFIFLFAKMLWGNLGGNISSLIWISYPPMLWFTKQPNSEIPFMAILYGGLLLFFYGLFHKHRRWYTYFFSGILIGYSMLLRPIAIGLGLVLSIIGWSFLKELRGSYRLFLVALFFLSNLVVILPWETYMYSKTGKIIPLSSAGVYTIRDGLTFGVKSKGFRKNINLSKDVKVLMTDISVHYSKLNTVGDIIFCIMKEVRARPLPVFKLFAIKAARSWYGTDSLRFEQLLLYIQSLYLLLIIGGGWIALKRGRISKKLVIANLIIILYFWIITTLALSILRYMVPAIGILFTLIPGLWIKNTSDGNKDEHGKRIQEMAR